ncbi:hypothetical protein KI387_021778 [Taxus chinensis]|uniref:Uncharacterized protein n=1 Tax=Taxus chinensis TaxID=29808 RepID=A0AA38GE46_TAXCH|nr:hypothetical protein KI387_021778 [Taxus chinensis]
MALALRKTRKSILRWINQVKTSGFHKTTHDNPFLGISKELRKRVTLLQCESARAPSGICNVYLVGICFISPHSFRDVKYIVRLLKPEIVFMEFDKERIENQLTPQEDSEVKGMSSFMDTVRSFWRKENYLYRLLSSLIYKRFSKEIRQDSEICRAYDKAYKEAMKYGGKVIFGDRAPHTFREQSRVSAVMSISEKTKSILAVLVLYFLPSTMFKHCISWYTKAAEDEILNEKCINRNFLDSEHREIVDEIEEYMCDELLKIASESRSVVAVVRGQHLPRIASIWKKAVGFETESTLFNVIKQKS